MKYKEYAYYWVQYKDKEWQPAQYFNGKFWLTGITGPKQYYHLNVIGEEIKTPESAVK